MQLAIRTVLSKYATFNGRASRSEFWWWMLSLFLFYVGTTIIDGGVIAPLLGFQAFDPDAGQPISLVASVLLIIPNIAVGVRRLHDGGRTGWWLLIAFVPVIGVLALLYFYIQPSEQDTNQYGPPEELN